MSARESTTQPIICCVGPSVAGQPTQFLLERAFEQTRLHWKAVSVEVEPDNFDVVTRGMLAMGFHGLRFFDQFQLLAAQNLTSAESKERFVGSATSAVRVNDGWQVWNNLGPAWLELLNSLQVSTVWLHGDNIVARSLFTQLFDSSALWLWTHAPADVREFDCDVETKSSMQSKLFATGQFDAQQIVDDLKLSIEPSDSDADSIDQTSAPKRVAIVSQSTSLPQDIYQLLAQANIELIVADNLALDADLASKCIHRITAADIAVTAEASDFKLWTHHAIDRSIVRDAYDEYCDF